MIRSNLVLLTQRDTECLRETHRRRGKVNRGDERGRKILRENMIMRGKGVKPGGRERKRAK